MCGFRQVVMSDGVPFLFEGILDGLMDAHYDNHAEDFRIEMELMSF